MGEYGKRAEQLFMEGYNCSQAVLLSYSDITGLDDKTAAMLASGFGGGLVYTIHKPSRKGCVKAKTEKRYFYGRIWQKSRATVYGRV